MQACPTGALMPAKEVGKEAPAKQVDSVCPYCGVGCQLTFNVKDNKILWVDGKDGPANHGRLCVKGRFGFDYVTHRHRLTTPLIRREDAPKSADIDIDPANPFTHFREASWDEALDVAAAGLKRIRDEHGAGALAGFGSAKGIERGGLSLPEARARGLRHQQRRSLHQALPRLVGRSAAGVHRLRRGHRELQPGRALGRHHRDRCPAHREPSGGRDLLQERGESAARS